MIWRAIAVLTVFFWAVMSGLLVRDVYFPEASRFAIVPPKVVIDLFLRQSDSFGSQLHLYHHHEKTGHASFQIGRRIQPDHHVVYDVLARGVVEGQDGNDRHHVESSWSVACILADSERWQHLKLDADFPDRNASLRMYWDEDQATPEVLVKQGRRVVLSSQDVKMLLGAGNDGLAALLPMLTGGMGKPGGKLDPMRLQGREGLMLLAGRERKCFVLTLPLFSRHEVKMLFTEAGELARIDLPDDYSLREPTIHGLQEDTR